MRRPGGASSLSECAADGRPFACEAVVWTVSEGGLAPAGRGALPSRTREPVHPPQGSGASPRVRTAPTLRTGSLPQGRAVTPSPFPDPTEPHPQPLPRPPLSPSGAPELLLGPLPRGRQALAG